MERKFFRKLAMVEEHFKLTGRSAFLHLQQAIRQKISKKQDQFYHRFNGKAALFSLYTFEAVVSICALSLSTASNCFKDFIPFTGIIRTFPLVYPVVS